MTRSFALVLALVSWSTVASAAEEKQPPSPATSPSDAQRAALRAHGFYIDPSQPAQSFHAGYNDVFVHDEPVYFTADAILHALHVSFDAILSDLEEEYLVGSMTTLVEELRAQLASIKDADATARQDLALYLGVAQVLLDNLAAPSDTLPTEAVRVALVLRGEGVGEMETELFGQTMRLDASQLKPRGHYAKSGQLMRYFQATMWLARTELRIATRTDKSQPWTINPRALAAARLLQRCFSPRAQAAWTRIDQTMGFFIGPANSLSFPALAALTTKLHGADDATAIAAFADAAPPQIRSQLAFAGEQHLSFVISSQRYAFDSEVLGSVVYDAIREPRMLPSPLDVGAAVFRNPVATQLLAPELAAYHYGDALAAVGRKGDRAGDALWHGSLYHAWLAALRGLSEPDDGAHVPWPLRGEAWNRRLLQSQLASWAELRHDTLLYVAQPYSMMATCSFPDAYVDPYPQFFAQVTALAQHAQAFVDALPHQVEHHEAHARITKYFGKLAAATTRLGAIAARERRGQPLNADDLAFMNDAVIVKINKGGIACGSPTAELGWYAELYFRKDQSGHAPVVADVHTAPTDAGGDKAGSVLSVGTGPPRTIVVELPTRHGPQRFRGFVSSYYELVTHNYERLNDQEWRRRTPRTEVPWMEPLLVK